jgi:hypothetical protein
MSLYEQLLAVKHEKINSKPVINILMNYVNTANSNSIVFEYDVKTSMTYEVLMGNISVRIKKSIYCEVNVVETDVMISNKSLIIYLHIREYKNKVHNIYYKSYYYNDEIFNLLIDSFNNAILTDSDHDEDLTFSDLLPRTSKSSSAIYNNLSRCHPQG